MRMRKLLSIFVLVLLTAAGLTGCLGAGDAGEGNLDAGGNETDKEGEDWEGMPDNRSGDYSAFEETNQTEEGTGGMAHDHDYWQGRSRVNIVETTAEMAPQPGTGGSSIVFKPPPPALVYEGTGDVEITISNAQRHACYPYLYYGGEYICTSNSGHWAGAGGEENYVAEPRSLPPMEVSYLHGASDPDDWISAGTMEWDTPFQIEVPDPMWTDMPHASASLWAFQFESQEPIDSTLVFDVTIDVVRDDQKDIPKWPGHPDFYPEKDWRVVYEGSGSSADGYGSTREYETLQPERLISYGTKTLHVWANITNLDSLSEGDAPTHWYLRFHDAPFMNWSITDPYNDDYAGDKTNHHWIIQVDPQGMDSPYQSKSRWGFQLRGAFTTPVISCIGGCMPPYQADYDLTVIATNQELPEDEYNPTSKA